MCNLISSVQNKIYLNSEKTRYSPVFVKNTHEAIRNLFQSAQAPSVILDNHTALEINGHTITVSHGTLKNIIRLDPETKKVSIDAWNKTFSVDGIEAKKFRQAIKELTHHVSDVGRKDVLTGKQMPPALADESSPMIADIQTIGYPIADTIGILRNLLSLLKGLSVLAVIPSWFVNNAQVIGSVIAGLRICQGILSLGLGGIKFMQAYQLYKSAEKKHDVEGMAIAKLQMINSAVVLLEGVLWSALGAIFLTCPQVGLGFAILQAALFYGGFTFDSILTLIIVHKAMKNIEKQYQTFKEGIVNNSHLSAEEKQQAAVRFLQRILNVTAEEEIKMKAKCQIKALSANTDKLQAQHKADQLFAQRMIDKIAKKRRVAASLGLSEDLYQQIQSGKVDACKKIQECFERSLAEQKAQKSLAAFCLLVNGLSLQLDLPEMIKEMEVLWLGLDPQIWASFNDFLWVGANAAYLAEDLSPHMITKLHQNEVSSEPQPSKIPSHAQAVHA